MILSKQMVPAFLFALSICAQTRTDEVAVLSVKTEAQDIKLTLPSDAPAAATPQAGLITDKNNKPLSPQPVVEVERKEPGSLQVGLSKLFFWGDAVLPFTFTPAAASQGKANSKAFTVTYRMRRGVGLYPSEIDIPRDQPGVIWILNPDVVGVQAKWRVVSATEALCGLDPEGQLRTDCEDVAKLPEIRIPATRSVPLRIYVPRWWRNPLHVFTGSEARRAQLQLIFGQDDPAQEMDAGIKLNVYSNAMDAATAWVPHVVYNLIRVLIWITVGAVLLMLAQVIIPNFSRSLQMEARIDGFRERLRAINSAVGNRLYTRCQNEIARVTEALGIREPDSRPPRAVRVIGRPIRLSHIH